MLKFFVLVPPEHMLIQFENMSKHISEEQLVFQKQIVSLSKQREELLPLLMNGQVIVE